MYQLLIVKCIFFPIQFYNFEVNLVFHFCNKFFIELQAPKCSATATCWYWSYLYIVCEYSFAFSLSSSFLLYIFLCILGKWQQKLNYCFHMFPFLRSFKKMDHYNRTSFISYITSNLYPIKRLESRSFLKQPF